MRHTFKGALHSVVATWAQVHPLPVQIQRESPQKGEIILDTGMSGTRCA